MKNNSATVYIIQSVILHLLSAGQYVHLPCRRAHICDSLSDVRQAKLVQTSWAIQPGRSLTWRPEQDFEHRKVTNYVGPPVRGPVRFWLAGGAFLLCFDYSFPPCLYSSLTVA